TERDRRRLVADLKAHDVKALMVDPTARAFVGDNINDTTQMTQWTNLVDEIAEAAAINEIVVMNHSGWDKERGRNSTVLEDWADVILMMVTGNKSSEDADTRYLSAIGRDVEITEDALDYDPEHRSFKLAGTGGRTNIDKIERLVPAV